MYPKCILISLTAETGINGIGEAVGAGLVLVKQFPHSCWAATSSSVLPQVHQQEVWEQTVKKVRDPANFDWQKQARFYWKQERDTAITSIADADTEYCYAQRLNF